MGAGVNSAAVRTRQPTQGTKIRRGNKLAKGLIFATTGTNGFIDYVSGKFPNSKTGANVINCTGGRAASPATSSGQITWPAGSTGLDTLTGPGTLLICFRGNNNTANWRAFGSREDSSTGDGVYLLYDDQNNASNGFNAGANNNNYRADSLSGALGTNSEQSFHTFGFSWDGSAVKLWADGQLNRTVTGGNAAFSPNSNSGRITRLQSGSGAASDFLFAYAWNRVLSPNEIAEITANPWQIFGGAASGAILVDVVSSGVSGTFSAVEPADSPAFSGEYATSGALSAVDGHDSASIAGTVVPPAVTGSLSAIDAVDSASFAGASTLPGVSGSLSAVDQPDIASLSGGIAFDGSMAAVEAQDAALFAGSAFAAGVGGVLAAADQADSAVFAGGYSLPAVSGSLTVTDQADVAVLSGLASPPVGAVTEIDCDRWLRVPAESRVYVVEPESRVLVVPGESRVLIQGE